MGRDDKVIVGIEVAFRRAQSTIDTFLRPPPLTRQYQPSLLSSLEILLQDSEL